MATNTELVNRLRGATDGDQLNVGLAVAWRVARSLDVLLRQLDRHYPARSRASDGSIGDAAHAASVSDHNPDSGGVVRARDFTHDPAHGVDIDRLSNELAASRDPRILYIIANGLILDTRPEFHPWTWQPYDGTNPHRHHLHLSVVADLRADDPRPWVLPMLKGDDMPSPAELWDFLIDDPYVGPDGKPSKPKAARIYLAYSAANAAYAKERAERLAAELAALKTTLPAMIAEAVRAGLQDGVVDVDVSVRNKTGSDA
ncbi:MAG: hypothetical protein ACRDRX_04365 [Pseudonocardiaceae bacterium]